MPNESIDHAKVEFEKACSALDGGRSLANIGILGETIASASLATPRPLIAVSVVEIISAFLMIMFIIRRIWAQNRQEGIGILALSPRWRQKQLDIFDNYLIARFASSLISIFGAYLIFQDLDFQTDNINAEIGIACLAASIGISRLMAVTLPENYYEKYRNTGVFFAQSKKIEPLLKEQIEKFENQLNRYVFDDDKDSMYNLIYDTKKTNPDLWTALKNREANDYIKNMVLKIEGSKEYKNHKKLLHLHENIVHEKRRPF